MGADQILNVNVIADIGAIGCGVIGSEDGDLLALSKSDLQNQWDQMAFRLVGFTTTR